MDPVDHVSDPVCLCGPGQGWTPPVSLHRLWTQPRAPGEEAAAQDHQQGTAPFPWQRDRQGPGAQHIVRIQERKQQQTVTAKIHNAQSKATQCVFDFVMLKTDTVLSIWSQGHPCHAASGCLFTKHLFSSHLFSFASSEGVSYMTVCHCSLPVAKAFCFLEDLRWEFTACFNSTVVALAARPYPFLEFGE